MAAHVTALFATPSFHVLVGPKFTGKSHLLRFLCYELARRGRINHVLCICPTAFTGSYSFLPAEHVRETYDEAEIHALLDEQQRLTEAGVVRRCALILDDCLGSANFGSALFTKLAATCRHFNTSVFVVCQYLNKLPPVLRENSEYYWVFRSPSRKSLEGIYNAVGTGRWATESEFRAFCDANTRDHRVILIDQREGGLRVLRAPARIPKFRLSY